VNTVWPPSGAGQRSARERFGIGRFIDAWQDVLRLVAG
jgi:hypothetical protein